MSGKSITQVYWTFKKDFDRTAEVSRDHGARQVHEDDFRNFDVILSFDDSNVADLKFPGRMMVALEQK